MPSTGSICVRKVFFFAVAVLALLTAPASAQKLIKKVSCSSDCDQTISCNAKVPGGVHDNERSLLIRRVFFDDGSHDDRLVGMSHASANVSGQLTGFPVDGQIITVMFCVGIEAATIPARACTNFFNFTYHDFGFCGVDRGGGGGGRPPHHGCPPICR
jgi:hypothetical protein